MADDDQDQEQKTEEPTQKRLEEAFKKGNVPNSRELSSFMMLAVVAMTVGWFAPGMMRSTQLLLVPFITDPEAMPADANGLTHLMQHEIFGSIGILAFCMICTVVAALASSFLQHGFMISFEPIMPKLSKISPIAGLGRLFSVRSLVEMLKSIVKLILVSSVAFIAVYPELVHIRQLPNSSTQAMLVFLGMLAVRLTMGVTIAMFFIALLDILYQRFQYSKSLRMTRQEIKDEYKQSEGDPMVKQKLRRLRQERARNRMMANVPKADVVVTNPTHYAVALKYDTKVMKAPMVVAKGQDLIALKIREIAEENAVPIMENPPLARALFQSTEIDQEIPFTHYEAVAKVISYVYKLKGKKF